MIKVGLTGSFGAGKSLVAGMFKARGARIIDADSLAHGILKEPSCCKAIAHVFGAEILDRKKDVDRAKLGRIVFADPKALKSLEAIVHPRLRKAILKEMNKAKGKVVVLNAAILIEAGWHKLVDLVVVVKAQRGVQLKRVMARTGLSKRDVLKRIRRQMPLSQKRKHAAYVIDNSGDAATTEEHVERVFRSLKNPSIQQESVS